MAAVFLSFEVRTRLASPFSLERCARRTMHAPTRERFPARSPFERGARVPQQTEAPQGVPAPPRDLRLFPTRTRCQELCLTYLCLEGFP